MLNHMERGRSEIFAQLMAIKYGGSPFPEDEALFIKAFPNVWKLLSGDAHHSSGVK